MSSRRGLVLLVLASALAVSVIVGGVYLAFTGSSSSTGGSAAAGGASALPAGPGEFAGAALPVALPAPPFTLTDQTGRRVSLADFHGRVVVLSFLYSTCGAPCIVVAQQIRGALDELPHPPPVLIISADPAADSPRNVERFLARTSLSGRVHYLTGSRADLERIRRAYAIAPSAADPTAFARAASVLLIDRLGRRHVLFGPEQLTPEALAHDIGKLQGG